MYIKRDFEQKFREIIRSRKVLIVYGSRQTGKTTLIEEVLKADEFRELGIVQLNGDVKAHCDLLAYETMTVEKAKMILGSAKILFVDEAQKILDIGLTLKIIHDNLKDVHVVATGSSSFELSEEVGEPLTGRMSSFVLPPLSFHEFSVETSVPAELAMLPTRLTYGSYPDVATAGRADEMRERLDELCAAYLFKDIFKWQKLKNAEIVRKLLKAVALQLGNEVSYAEVGDLIGMDNETVAAYHERLEKAFVIFRLQAFSRNLRNELKKSRKVYFCDVGIRNAILGNYLPLDCRDDVGHLFENYLIAERGKTNNYLRRNVQRYFWRTTSPSDGEVDYIEESPTGELTAYEFKFNPKKAATAKCPEKFKKAYPHAIFRVVSTDNYADFISCVI